MPAASPDVSGVSLTVPPLVPEVGLALNHGEVSNVAHACPVEVVICTLRAAGKVPPTVPLNCGLAGFAVMGPEGAGLTVSVALLEIPLKEPVMVTLVADGPPLVLMTNAAPVEPAGTVTLVGTVALAVLLLKSETTAPPEGAADVRVTVPCEVLPPTTLVGKTETADKLGGVVAVVITSLTVTIRSGCPEQERRKGCV